MLARPQPATLKMVRAGYALAGVLASRSMSHRLASAEPLRARRRRRSSPKAGNEDESRHRGLAAAAKRDDIPAARILAGVSHDLRRFRLRLKCSKGPGDDGRKAWSRLIIDQFLASPATRPAAGPLDAIVERYVRRRVGARRGNDPSLPCRQRLCSNLVNNALRYAGSPVEIETRHDTGSVIVSVLDRGPGIPPDAVEHMLQPFAPGCSSPALSGTCRRAAGREAERNSAVAPCERERRKLVYFPRIGG